jgi:hypothetical protein
MERVWSFPYAASCHQREFQVAEEDAELLRPADEALALGYVVLRGTRIVGLYASPYVPEKRFRSMRKVLLK